KNYDLVHEALVTAGRQDLIGYDSKCLIRPRKAQNRIPENNKPKDRRKPPKRSR
ncbi:MAG: DUF3362 domain-containing protein, partial [Oscillospiraceae bacterium]|nr:DUF3362 domain-containing protein [Oscillospiraceae bacterium]